MPAAKNVLLIVVDQWRGLMLPKLGADYLKLPNIDRLCAEGVTFRNHFTQCCALRAGAGQPADRPLPDEPSRGAEHHSARRALHQPGARAAPRRLRPGPGRLHHDHARSAHHRAQRSALLRAGRHHGRLPLRSAPSRTRDAYFGWVASQGFKLPENREDIWLPEGRARRGGATARPARIPKELSDTAWFTERGLTYLRGRAGKPWFLHLGYYRPHPPFIAPAPYHAMYRPEDMPKAGARGLAGGGGQAERAARLLREQHQAGELLPGRQGPRLGDERGSEVAQMRATYCGLMSEIDDQLGRVFDYLKADRPVGRHADRLHLRSRRAARRPSPAGQDRLFRRVLSHPDDRARSARRGQRHARHDRRAASPRPSTPCRPSSNGSACRSRASATAARCCGFCEGRAAGRLAHRGALRVRLPRSLLQPARIVARRADGQVRARRRAGRGLQVRALRRAAAAVLRSQGRSRPVRQPRRRSRLCRAAWANTPHKMLDWRLGFADRTLTGYRATPNGLEVRAA